MDFQNRAGGKTGSGGQASWSDMNRDRRERLRQLALETIDLAKGGYIRYKLMMYLKLHGLLKMIMYFDLFLFYIFDRNSLRILFSFIYKTLVMVHLVQTVTMQW